MLYCHTLSTSSSKCAVIHQFFATDLAEILNRFVREHRLGRVSVGPLDVRLSKHDVLEPDVPFVSKERLGIVGPTNLGGAPDLVVEVLSPSTRRRGGLSSSAQSLAAASGSGGAVFVAWSGFGPGTGNDALIFLRRIEPRPMSSVWGVREEEPSPRFEADLDPAIAAEAGGDSVAVAWVRRSSPQRVMGRVFGAGGSPRGAEVAISPKEGARALAPSLVWSGGHFLAAWLEGADAASDAAVTARARPLSRYGQPSESRCFRAGVDPAGGLKLETRGSAIVGLFVEGGPESQVLVAQRVGR